MIDEILVVDDEEVCRDLLQDVVVDRTARSCRAVSSGEEALELISRSESFALAIVDAHMPGMSGIELLRKAKEIQPELDVIVVTGYKGKYSFADVIRAGASDYMTKPFEVDEIEAKIKRVLRERALINELRRGSACRAAHDEVARSYSEAAARSEFERARALLDSVPDGVLIIDEAYTIQFANAAIENMFNLAVNEAMGQKCYSICREKHICGMCPAKTVFDTRMPGHATRMIRNRFGEVLFYELRTVPLVQDRIDRPQVMEFVRDVTEIREVEAELRRLSIKDVLTDLSNRRHFLEVLEREMYRGKRQDTVLSLLFTDIDGFKLYNDTRGHLAGDDVLVRMGQLMGQCIRIGVDTAYRLGGDEFTAILPHTNLAQASRVARRLLKRFRSEKLPNLSLSIGVVEYDESLDIVQFVDQADKAMYRAKGTGGDRIEQG
jgi:two-component system cell cycle response regulator